MVDLWEILSSVPWWIGVLLAGGAYFLVHPLAIQELPVHTGKPGAAAHVATGSLVKARATYFQYILPAFFLACAVASALGRMKRQRLLKGASQSDAAGAIAGMTWQSFELLVGEAFRQQGYSVIETGGRRADGGVDLILARGGETFLVQCKQWKAFKVGVEIVRELYGVMAARGAAGGFVVTSGQFTEPAIAFSEGRNIELIDGLRLKSMINQVQNRPVTAEPRESVGVAPAPALAAENTDSAATPACPKCSRPMVRRITKRGSRQGLEFWGCSGYPGCRGIVPMVPGN